jgi:uncharacterized membrane protein HdeD (DUF308 family)
MLLVLARNWWMLALRGLVAVLFGLVAIVWPGLTLTALVLLFGAYALVDGVFAVVSALRTASRQSRWWMLLIEGVIGIVIGVVTFLWPDITALALLYLIAAWAIVTGVFEILAAIRLRREITGEWLLALSGIASVLFGLLLVILPGAGALAVVWLIGIYALIFGVLLIVLAFRLRSWGRTATRRTQRVI